MTTVVSVVFVQTLIHFVTFDHQTLSLTCLWFVLRFPLWHCMTVPTCQVVIDVLHSTIPGSGLSLLDWRHCSILAQPSFPGRSIGHEMVVTLKINTRKYGHEKSSCPHGRTFGRTWDTKGRSQDTKKIIHCSHTWYYWEDTKKQLVSSVRPF